MHSCSNRERRSTPRSRSTPSAQLLESRNCLEKFTFSQGAVLPLAVSTAADGFYGSPEKGPLGIKYPELGQKADEGSVLVVDGASSSVGIMAVQMAAASGAKVAAVASSKNFEFCRGAGASEVFDYKDNDVVEEVVCAVKNSGLKFTGVYDAVSTQDQSFKITIPVLEEFYGGSLAVVYESPKSSPTGVKSTTVWALNSTTDPAWVDFVLPALEQGTMKRLPEPKVVDQDVEAIQEGLDQSKKGVCASKIVTEL